MTDSCPSELRDLLALHLVPGLGPRLTAALLDQFGSAGEVLQATPERLRAVPHIGAKLSDSLVSAIRAVDVGAELELMAKHDVHLIAHTDPRYPATLATIPDPPHLLYLRGTLEPADANAVALVGSRHCTSYGRRVAERLAADLARAGFTVISGLARGIDAAAHRGALEAGGRTLAVLAGGLSRIYPPEHEGLAREVERDGALLTESVMGQEPIAGLFPVRNRLISGLSRGIVVVEAAEKSGALITARHAAEQGRQVFAVPGPVDSPACAGTLQLLREGATLVRGAADIIEDLDGVAAIVSPTAQQAKEAPADMDDVQRRIWEFLSERSRHMDEMAQHLGLSVPQIAGALLRLEMKKAVRRLPGNYFERQ